MSVYLLVFVVVNSNKVGFWMGWIEASKESMRDERMVGWLVGGKEDTAGLLEGGVVRFSRGVGFSGGSCDI